MAGYEARPIKGADNPAFITLVTTAATLAVVSEPIDVPGPNANVFIEGHVYMSAGTGTTQVDVKIYRGPNNTYALATSYVQNTAGGDVLVIPWSLDDEPGEVSGLQYSVYVTQLSATGNGTIEDANINGFLY